MSEDIAADIGIGLDGVGELSQPSDNNLQSNNEDVCLDEEEYIELTKETLLLIENNDPSITSLKLKGNDSDFYTVGEWRRVHNAIGNNTHIKRFEISNYLDSDLCYGIANNRSIQHLELIDIYDLSEEMLSILSPIFENNDVRSLHIIQCEVGGEQNKDSDSVTAAIASTLSKFNTLTSFNLAANHFEEVQSAKIVGALCGHSNLADIDLGMNYLGEKGCMELGKVLKVCKVKKLDLGYCDINNECAAILVNALRGNTTLKELALDGNNGEYYPDSNILDTTSWEAILSLLTSVPLEVFSVYNTNIDDDEEALLLAEKLTNNSTLKDLNIGDTHFGPSGWRRIFTSLQTASALEKLVISEARGINDSHMPLLWEVISKRSLKELEFNGGYIGSYSSISAQGLQTIGHMLESPHCKLERLHLRGEHHFKDDMITEFVQRLANNTCLKELGISSSRHPGTEDRRNTVTLRGWETLSTLLCDVSSIDNTYSSNHTLSVSVDSRLSSLYSRLTKLSNINQNKNRSDAAREKIMKYQFNTSEESYHTYHYNSRNKTMNYHYTKPKDGTLSNGMQVVTKMDLVVLPRVIAWAGRKHDSDGCTILYQLLRCIPELVEDQSKMKMFSSA